MNVYTVFFMFIPFCYAGYFDNFTNLISYSYAGENCATPPVHVNISDTVSCLSYKNISMCCKVLMKLHNYDEPLNICYNKDGNSSFTSCYQQQLTQTETNTLGALAIFGLFFFLFISVSCIYLIYSCCFGKQDSVIFGRRRMYKSIN